MVPSVRWLGLSAVLLADAFPGSCGGNKGGDLLLSSSDCSCLPATVAVTVGLQPPQPVELVCGRKAAAVVDEPGQPRVTVRQGTVVWYDRELIVERDQDVDVPLACPPR